MLCQILQRTTSLPNILLTKRVRVRTWTRMVQKLHAIARNMTGKKTPRTTTKLCKLGKNDYYRKLLIANVPE